MITYDVAKLRKARMVKGWTVVKLARIVGLHYSTVTRIEHGENQNPGSIKKLADALEVPMEDLLIEEEATA